MDEDKVAETVKAYREEMEYCWNAAIAVPAHVVMSRERLLTFIQHDIPWLIEKERLLLEKKLTAMRHERRRQLH